MQGVSIVLCCHNSAGRLGPTLAHLAQMRAVANMAVDIVLVDNASRDDTAAVATQLWQELGAPWPLEVVEEARPGLSFARQRGVQAARQPLISFVDDDNWVAPDWLAVIARVFDAHPRVGIVGGCGTPVFDGFQRPDWFDRFAHGFACGPQSDTGTPQDKAATPGGRLVRRPWVYGAGMTVRAEVFKALAMNDFSPELSGRQGGRLLSGEDTELCVCAAAHGWWVWYEPALRFHHAMTPARCQPEYVMALFGALGASSVSIDRYIVAFGERSWFWSVVQLCWPLRLGLAGGKALWAWAGAVIGGNGLVDRVRAAYMTHRFIESARQWRVFGRMVRRHRAYLGRIRGGETP